MPITSYGLIVFRKCPANNSVREAEGVQGNSGKRSTEERSSPEFELLPEPVTNAERIEYLMIRRRDTLGFIDFMRGKYSVYNKEYILNMIVQMTVLEKTRLLTHTFNEIWAELWGNETMVEQYRSEEDSSREKITSLRLGVVVKDDFYTLETLIKSTENETTWKFAEWGFPKGRRNYQEKDYECAVREFCEETGYPSSSLVPIQNIHPFEEIFTGSNYKSYKHKYYLTHMDYSNSLRDCVVQSCEVSCAEWKTYEGCMQSIRHYNVEKKRVLENVHKTITEFLL
jgi:ADP-ribose pyrophosphatase YjhB (NUDIX family)